MRGHLIGLLFSSSLLFACAAEAPPPPAPPAASATPPPVAVVAPPPADTTPPAPEPTPPEERQRAEARKQLQDDRAKWQKDHEAELARWTPAMHAAGKALAGKPYPTLHAALTAVLSGPQRKPGDADRDPQRHPQETLAFFGIRPNMRVLEVGPGEGWYTEILAPTLAARGTLFDTTSDPNGPEDSRGTFAGQRFKAMLDEAPEVFGKVQTIVVDGKAPKLETLSGNADAVLLMREVHGMINAGTLDAWLVEIRKALKAGGVLGIEEHRASPDADPVASSKNGYVPQKWLIDHIEGAGFKLAGKSEINANPKDTKDYAVGVWALPPTLQLGAKDREKYLAIGESDRMTLKFVKVDDKKTK